MAQVDVEINGKTFRMACNDGEEDRLRGLASRVDTAISQLRDDFGEIGDQRLTVMASIMMADELTELERQIQIMKADLEDAKTRAQEALSQSDTQQVRREADIAELSKAHQNQLSEVRRTHSEEITEICKQIDQFSEKLEELARSM